MSHRDPVTLLRDRFFESTGEDEAVSRFVALLESADGETVTGLLEQIDESDYSVSDWANALLGFDRWLSVQGIAERPLGEMTGYVHCCTMMSGTAVSLPNLEALVVQSLANFGFHSILGSQN